MSNPMSLQSSADHFREGHCPEGGAGLLPVDPFRSLRLHFGMLLGVDDFETLDAYHRGKMWLHNAWLHGKGVVWGLGVAVDTEAGEVRVKPGLALDALGRELLLEIPVCLDVARWFEEHEDEVEVVDGAFTAHVVIRFKACLTRQVPALVEPCEGSGQTTAYSRVVETVELEMRPGPAPERHEPPGTLPYHRLRLLFALEDPIEDEGIVIAADQEVLDRRQAILALPAEDQPRAYLEAFRDFAALDEIDLAPATAEEGEGLSLFPATDPAPLVLAQIDGLILTPSGDGHELSLATDGGADNTVRFSHVATSTIQELLNGPLFSAPAAPPPPQPDARGGLVDAGGPRANPARVKLTAKQIAFSTDKPLAAASVTGEAVSVTAFGEEGWTPVAVSRVRLLAKGKRVSVVFGEELKASLVRLIARGTGPAPLMGAGGVPFAGSPADPPATAHNGNDFVVMKKRS